MYVKKIKAHPFDALNSFEDNTLFALKLSHGEMCGEVTFSHLSTTGHYLFFTFCHHYLYHSAFFDV